MTNTPNLEAAQPTFSDEELAVLFRALNIEGDVHNEGDRERVLEALSKALLDTTRTDQVLAALGELDDATEAPTTDEHLLTGVRATPITRRAPDADAARAAMDDAPSTGRLLNALHVHTQGPGGPPLRVRPEQTLAPYVGVVGGHLRAAGDTDLNIEAKQLELLHAEHDANRSFILKAREALPERSASLRERLVDAFEALTGVASPSSWQAAKFVMDVQMQTVEVQVRHGARLWHILVRFGDPMVFVQVANEHRTVIERDVATSQPEDFSHTLLRALDGDVRSTQMALDAVQQAMAVH